MIVGVDGCAAGWLCVFQADEQGPLQATIHSTFGKLLVAIPGAKCLAIDIPIGLPESGSRGCDTETRRLIKPRGSSVFPAPIRGVLNSATYEEANQKHRAIAGKGFTKQAFAILPKIAEVDTVLRARPELNELVFEVHPELSFRTWAGRPIEYPKKDPDGALERRALIDSVWPDAVRSLRSQLSRSDYALDDLHDAFAALWTARRIVAGTAVQVPSKPEFDAVGLPMRMMA